MFDAISWIVNNDWFHIFVFIVIDIVTINKFLIKNGWNDVIDIVASTFAIWTCIQPLVAYFNPTWLSMVSMMHRWMARTNCLMRYCPSLWNICNIFPHKIGYTIDCSNMSSTILHHHTYTATGYVNYYRKIAYVNQVWYFCSKSFKWQRTWPISANRENVNFM